MTIAAILTSINIIIFLLFLGGCVWLQIFLSRKRNKWLGLIIPLICFLFSILMVCSMAIYTGPATTTVTQIVDGVQVTNETITSQQEKPSMITILATVLPVFIVANIPTVIFMAIYFASREKLKLKSELDKMNAQDL